MDEVLEELYYNPKNNSAFGGVDRLHKRLRNVRGYEKVSKDDVKKWLSSQETYTLFRDRLKNNYPSWKYFVHQIDQQWSIDLADMQSISTLNDGFRYLLCVIDVFSKFAWVEPIKSKVINKTIILIIHYFQVQRYIFQIYYIIFINYSI
jgi:hypothetical protein